MIVAIVDGVVWLLQAVWWTLDKLFGWSERRERRQAASPRPAVKGKTTPPAS